MRLPLQATVDPDTFACTGTGGDLEAGTAGSSIAGGAVTAGQQEPPDRKQARNDRGRASFDTEQGDSDLDEGWLGQDPVDEDEQSSAEEHGCAGDQGTDRQKGLAKQPQQLTFGNPQAELVARGLEAGLRKEQSGLSAASGATRSSRRPCKEQSGLSGSSSGFAAALNGARGRSRKLRQQLVGLSDASGANRGGERRLDDEEQRSSQDKEEQDDVLTSTGQGSEVCCQGGGVWQCCCLPLTVDTHHRQAPRHLAGLVGKTFTQQRGRDRGQQLNDVLITRQGQIWQCYAANRPALPDLSRGSNRTGCSPLRKSSTVQPVILGRLAGLMFRQELLQHPPKLCAHGRFKVWRVTSRSALAVSSSSMTCWLQGRL